MVDHASVPEFRKAMILESFPSIGSKVIAPIYLSPKGGVGGGLLTNYSHDFIYYYTIPTS